MRSNMNYTLMLGNVMTELDPEFKFFHTREEARMLLRKIINKVENNRIDNRYRKKESVIDAYIVQQDKHLRKLFREAAEDYINSNEKEKANEILEKLKALPERITEITEYNDFNERYKNNCKEIIEMLISVDENDDIFIKKLLNKLDEFASSKDYMRRLVINRLYDISPEFVCERNENGELETDEEKKYILTDPEKLPSTRLLIMKQFIKQFHWCEEVSTGGGANNSPDKIYACPIIGVICEKVYSGDFEKMACDINEDFFDLIGMNSNNEDKSAKAEAYVKGKLGEPIEEAAPDIRRSAITNVKIIKVADTLADALFDDSGNTPLKLYMFAIAFDMEVKFSSMTEAADSSENRFTDIRKNLFYDYYCENLANYLTLKNKGSQLNITGYGINVKNFAEIIFIYFLLRNDLSALEKLQKSTDMITKCCEIYRNGEVDMYPCSKYAEELIKEFSDFNDEDDPEDIGFDPILTQQLISSETMKKLLKCNEEDFMGIILKQWDLSHSSSVFKGSSVYHTAVAYQYSTIEADIRKVPKEIQDVQINIGSDVSDSRITLLVERFNTLLKREKDLRKWYRIEGKADIPVEYRTVSSKVADADGKKTKVKKKYDEKEEAKKPISPVIDRCTLLFALCDKTVLKIKRLDSARRNSVLSSYNSFYRYFSTKYNSTLIDCGFQEIISKNIFDLLVVYLAYKKCNIDMKGNEKNI